MYFIMELIGTIAFAISGAMVGIRAKMDILGVCVLGLTTAVGGGIIRDLLIGQLPPAAFQSPVYALLAIAVSFVVFFPRFRKHINTNGFVFNLMDAIGLGVFTVIGVKAGVSFANPFLELFLGTVTGVGGGVLRDIFATEKPMIFVKNVYALASIVGALVCILLLSYSENLAMVAGTATVVILRVLAAKFCWDLPKA